MILLVVFLGNYGDKYAGTRHNVAWDFCDSLPFCHKLSWQNKFRGKYAFLELSEILNTKIEATQNSSSEKSTNFKNKKIYFLKPHTYMNASGQSISELAQFFKIKPEEILVVHDELELPLGSASLKYSGGLGGHNGLRSTKSSLGTERFWRLRFGIGRPLHQDVAGYVLSNFTQDEKITLSQIFEKSSTLLINALSSENPEKLLGKISL